MTVFASVCVGMLAVCVRSLLWHVSAMWAWDGSWREWYVWEAAKLEGITPRRDPRRSAIKAKTRRYLTPFGRAFSEQMRPTKDEQTRVGHPNRTNQVVNRAARTGLIIAIPILLFLTGIVVHVGSGGPVVLRSELGVAVCANLGGYGLARAVERTGPLMTILGALLGALLAGLAAGFLLCKCLPFRLATDVASRE